jgi:hypothetical protein
VQGAKPDLAAAQVGDDGDQVLQGAAESGQLGDYEGAAFEQLIESLGQSWAVGVFSGELVMVDAFAADCGQGGDLAVENLAAPTGAGIADQMPACWRGSEQVNAAAPAKPSPPRSPSRQSTR